MTTVNALINMRGRASGSLTKIVNFAAGITKATTITQIELRLTKLEEAWAEFTQAEDRLANYEPKVESKYNEFEDRYFDTKSVLVDVLKARRNETLPPTTLVQNHSAFDELLAQQRSFFENLADRTMNATMSSPTTSTRLPKLHIEPFSGEFSSWPAFKDLYMSSVHNHTSLSGSQKFQMLKGLLKGEPASLVKHFSVTDASYTEAWSKLLQRYDRTKPILSALISSFLSQPSATTPESLRKLSDRSDEVIRGIKCLGSNAKSRDPWLIHILLNKIDEETQEVWAEKTLKNEFPSIEEFLNFLSDRCDAKESISSHTKRRSTRTPAATKSFHASVEEEICPNCKHPHKLHRCIHFKRMPIATRRSVVNDYAVCYNCLNKGHSVSNCNYKQSCKVCQGRHHTMLHSYIQPNNSTNTNSTTAHISTISSDVPSTSNSQQNNSPNEELEQITPIQSYNATVSCATMIPLSLLPTAIVHVRDIIGNIHTARALLDSCGQSSFISSKLAKKLNLKVSFASIPVTGIEETVVATTKGLVHLLVQSPLNQSEQLNINALIVNKVTTDLPLEEVQIKNYNKLKSLQLADKNFDKPGNIDLLLGADVFFQLIKPGNIKIDENITAQSTMFGWVIAGKLYHMPKKITSCTSILHEQEINETPQRFWKIEEVPDAKLTTSEILCEQYFSEHTIRQKDGRYVVSLPFKEKSAVLGNSKSAAVCRLLAMERKFNKMPELKDQYIKFMNEYLQLGHMEEIPTDDIHINEHECYYLPHHAVFKQDSTTTKLRVVFDGSCKSSTGVSLNEKLMVGPTLQQDLACILLRFRKHAIAFTADVEKMYRQVLVNKSDQKYQRIVWRDNNTEPIKHFPLKTVTYETSCAPFLAIRVLQQIANENLSPENNIFNVIKNDFYVDDLISGTNDTSSAIEIQRKITNILGTAGFPLRKWKSNSAELMDKIPTELKEVNILILDDESVSVKTLGLQWHPGRDTFSYKLKLEATEVTSKREMFSRIGSIYDPLGWISPVTITLKLLMQKLWIRNLSWDDKLPEDIQHQWNNLQSTFDNLQDIKISRFLKTYTNTVNTQLHCFCDASESAYAAVIYIRTEDVNGNINVEIEASKTRVAPLKPVSLPRLELCGAVLLTKLLEFVTESLQLPSVEVHAWTDSKIVLDWLSDHPRKFQCFIANRTTTILNIIPINKWRHVPSKENPADLCSRGVAPSKLVNSSLWWHGPNWIYKSELEWPQATSIEREMNIIDLMQICEKICIQYIQNQAFPEDIKMLINFKELPPKSKLSALAPFIDNEGILRVGGRLSNLNEKFDVKHPIILPKNHIITNLIIHEAHIQHLHPGPSLLTSILRQQYWILDCKNVVRYFTQKCVSCFRQRAAITKQLMGNLPSSRITPSRPFQFSGVDYAGPIYLKSKVGRGKIPVTKGYVCIFVCFSTKAIHIELVSDMTTEAFIAALRRFISRRGIPTEIISDNGTNFVGAQRELKELYELNLSQNHNKLITDFLLQNQIKFHFNPASAPHFNGLAESTVKSIKHHLRRVTTDACMTFEEMATLLTQIEAILNSRPLCPSTNDIDEITALTPGHFLIGEQLTSIPEPDLEAISANRLSRWQNIQSRVQGFWKRWSQEYLHHLQLRQKWKTKQINLRVNDIVLIHDANLPPTKWLLGIIKEIHPGKDNLIRVVTVKTATGELKRPVVKLSKLPTINDNNPIK